MIKLCAATVVLLTFVFSQGANLQAREQVEAATPQPEIVDFNRDIRPLFSDTCFNCHGPDTKTRKGKLRLDTQKGAFKDLGGYAAIVPGDLENSELIARITSDDKKERMPPRKFHRQLTGKQIELIKLWVKQGAKFSQHWAYAPPVRPPLPKVQQPDWPVNGIDYFIAKRLEREQLKPSPRADKVTLLRRVSIDLIGLPPTPEQVDDFLADTSPNAYEKVVDRLLASPAYGEHKAVAWLDASRYADTDGYQNDRYRYQWVWRDWVIRALNNNQSFDQFIIEQLAGDLLPKPDLYQQIATGFGRNHRINSEAGSIAAEWQVEYVADRVDTLGTMMLGLTVGCARCHDHKYDPITQKEYYQLFAYFNNIDETGMGPNNGNSPPYIKMPKSWPNLTKADNKFIKPAKLSFKNKNNSFSGGVKRPTPGGTDTVMIMQERDKPRTTYLLNRGVYNQPDKSQKLSPGIPASLSSIDGAAPKNRLELARWLTNEKNPLLARVTVNRYWQSYFGAGLVRTSENFGSQGEPPSHPQLLDWLATEFVRLKWDVKAMHKLIVMSATYQQSSNITPKLDLKDPNNRLLARGPRFRLTAQALRDQALAASGLLTTKLYGPSVKPYMPPRIWRAISNNTYKQDKGTSLYRRSLYTYWRRTIPPPTMATFNAAEREVCIVRKDRTNTPLQALTLMNNKTFVEASRFVAERMISSGGKTPADQIAYGYRLLICREPTPDEAAILMSAYNDFHTRYKSAPSEAAQLLAIGEKPREKNLNLAQHAALTMIANTIMNMDEAINKE